RGHHRREISDLFRVVQHLLAVARSEPQDAEVADHLGAESLKTDLQDSCLPLLFDPLQDLLPGLGDYLFDAGGVYATVDDELVQRELGRLAADWVEAADDHRLRRVIHYQVDSRRLLEGAD